MDSPNNDNIVRQIILYAALFPSKHSIDTTDHLKRLVPYIGVARKWREPFIKNFYGTALVHCDIPDNKIPKRNGGILDSLGSKNGKQKGGASSFLYNWRSNISLIGHNKYSHTTTKIHIRLTKHFPGYLLPLDDILSALGLDLFEWSNVTELTIDNNRWETGQNNIPIVKPNTADMDEVVEKSHTIADYFYRHMPNIHRIVLFNFLRHNPNMKWMNNQIANLFACQLTSLYSQDVLMLPVHSFGDCLTSLDMKMDSRQPFSLPKLNIEQLGTLCLRDVPHDFTWAKLLHTSKEEVHMKFISILKIEFYEEPVPVVKTAAAEGSSSKNRGIFSLFKWNNKGKEEIPEKQHLLETSSVSSLDEKVKHLNIKDASSDISVIYMNEISFFEIRNHPADGHALDPVIKLGNAYKIDFTGEADGYVKCNNIQFKSAKIHRFSVSNFDQDKEESFYLSASKLYSSFIPAERMELTIEGGGLLKINPNIVQWFNLTNLKIYRKIPFSNLLDLIPRLPNLIQLCITQVFVDAHVSLFEEAEKPAPSLDTRIQELFKFGRDGSQLTVKYMVYLAKRMPFLTSLSVPNCILKATKTSVMSVQTLYPHLQNVNVYSKIYY